MFSKLQLNKIYKKNMESDFAYISNVFWMFDFGIIRFNILQVTQNATHLSQHYSIKGANVHEMTLGIAYGALRFGSC